MFKFRNATTVAPATAASIAPDFPSRDAIAKIRELRAHVDVLKIEVADAERALALTIKNRELVELGGENPDGEIRRKQVALDQARRRFSNAKTDLARVFVDEGKRRAENHAEAWRRTYLEIVAPRVQQLTATQELLEKTMNEIIALLAPGSAEMRRLEAIDAATNSWNLMCGELFAPANAQLNVTPVTKTIFSSFLQAIKFRQFEVAWTELRDTLVRLPAPLPPLTEEKIKRDRERAAENLRLGLSKLEAEQQQLATAKLAGLAELAKPIKQ